MFNTFYTTLRKKQKGNKITNKGIIQSRTAPTDKYFSRNNKKRRRKAVFVKYILRPESNSRCVDKTIIYTRVGVDPRRTTIITLNMTRTAAARCCYVDDDLVIVILKIIISHQQQHSTPGVGNQFLWRSG